MSDLPPAGLIRSNRLTLRPLSAADRDLVDAIYGDARVTGGYGMPPFVGKQLEEKFQMLLGPWSISGFSQFVIIENSNGGAAGLGGVRPAGHAQEGEIGYALLPESWGRGIASHAIELWTAWAFDDLRLSRVVAEGVENPASIRALEKTGYAIYEEQTTEQRRLVSLELLADQWRAKNQDVAK